MEDMVEDREDKEEDREDMVEDMVEDKEDKEDMAEDMVEDKEDMAEDKVMGHKEDRKVMEDRADNIIIRNLIQIIMMIEILSY
jgi:Fe2+ transport system protein B